MGTGWPPTAPARRALRSSLPKGWWRRSSWRMCPLKFLIKVCRFLELRVSIQPGQEWKSGTHSLGNVAAFQPQADDVPEGEDIQPPELMLAVVTEHEGRKCLALPASIREKWQNDPVRKDAWMQELQAFDARSIVTIVQYIFVINLLACWCRCRATHDTGVADSLGSLDQPGLGQLLWRHRMRSRPQAQRTQW